MLLNEFLKEHQKVERLQATVASLVATVNEQAAQIQKVNDKLELSILKCHCQSQPATGSLALSSDTSGAANTDWIPSIVFQHQRLHQHGRWCKRALQ